MLFELMNKYLDFAQFNWCYMRQRPNGKLYFYDLEERKYRSLSYVLRCVLDNGMLDECYTLDELLDLAWLVPLKFTKEIVDYIKEYRYGKFN